MKAKGVVKRCGALNVRKAAVVNPNNIVSSIPCNTEIEILNTNPKNGFYRIRLADGLLGYAMADYIDITDDGGENVG